MKKKPYIIACFFFSLDLLSKQIIMRAITLGQSITVIDHFFFLTYTRNSGAAWSILKDQRILLMLITVIVLFLINQFINKEKLGKYEEIIYGMIIGGITGNLFDRLVYREVIDFLDFHIFGYHYPIFNFADTFIVVGIIWLIILGFLKEHYGKNNRRNK